MDFRLANRESYEGSELVKPVAHKMLSIFLRLIRDRFVATLRETSYKETFEIYVIMFACKIETASIEKTSGEVVLVQILN